MTRRIFLWSAALFLAACAPAVVVPTPVPQNPPVVKTDAPVAVTPVPVPAPANARKFALLIGINEYGSGNNLRGCINDIKTWEAWLDKLGGWHVVRLLDRNATALHIRAACLRLRIDARAGDSILIVFSGHGTQVSDPRDPDGLDESICATDVMEDWDRNNITGREFRGFLDAIPNEVNVSVFLDSCHAGTSIRDIRKGVKNRYLPPPVPVVGNRTVKTLGQFTRDARPFLAFYAGCQKGQTSADAEFAGVPGGAFTVKWFDGLTPAETLADAAKRLEKKIKADGFDQTPLLQATQVRLVAPFVK